MDMAKHSIIFAFAIIILLFSNHPAQAEEEAIPLKKGNYWIYEGNVQYADKSGQSLEKTITWKMRIIDVIERGDITAALVKGHLNDLIWYKDDKQPGQYLIIRVGSGNYYLINDTQVNEIIKRLKDPNDTLGSLVSESDLFLDYPLAVGKVYGESEQLTRVDMPYYWIWHVESAKQVKLSKTKGIPDNTQLTAYMIRMQANTDHQIIEFVPSIGITGFVFNHHGSVSEVDIHLIEFHKEK